MADSETVTVSWPQHHRVFVDRFWDFFLQKYEVDVKLACHGHFIQAHRLVLSMFSPRIRNCLETFMEADPLSISTLDLGDVTEVGQDLDLLVEFMYRGKINLRKNQLEALQNSAKSLGVQGLVEAIRTLRDSSSEDGAAEAATEEQNSNQPSGVDQHGARKRKGKPIKLEQTKGKTKRGNHKECRKRNSQGATDSKPAVETHPEGQVSSSSPSDVDDPPSESEWSADVSDSGKTKRQPPATGRVMRLRTECKRRNRSLLDCPHCEYSTRDKNAYQNHLGKHGDSGATEQFVCIMCHKQYRNKKSHDAHMRLHSFGDASEQWYTCRYCSYHTLRKASWLQHLAEIHKEDPDGNKLQLNNKCPECDFACVTEYRLKAHMRWKHPMEKPYKCPECSYSAISKCDMDKHLSVTHSTERPFMCETCGFRSKTVSAFNSHVRAHTGVKPYQCDICGKAYSRGEKLRIHLQKHANAVKPYVCHLCGHSCRRRDNLQMHLKRIHKTNLHSETLERMEKTTPSL